MVSWSEYNDFEVNMMSWSENYNFSENGDLDVKPLFGVEMMIWSEMVMWGVKLVIWSENCDLE